MGQSLSGALELHVPHAKLSLRGGREFEGFAAGLQQMRLQLDHSCRNRTDFSKVPAKFPAGGEEIENDGPLCRPCVLPLNSHLGPHPILLVCRSSAR